jgi:hypothetical protein
MASGLIDCAVRGRKSGTELSHREAKTGRTHWATSPAREYRRCTEWREYCSLCSIPGYPWSLVECRLLTLVLSRVYLVWHVQFLVCRGDIGVLYPLSLMHVRTPRFCRLVINSPCSRCLCSSGPCELRMSAYHKGIGCRLRLLFQGLRDHAVPCWLGRS